MVDVRMIKLPKSTDIGKPFGEVASKEIAPGGGTISSSDGKVELIFPDGALSKPTTISIQPISTTIPNGNKAYRFEPSGTKFNKPVQVVFHYTDYEAAICSPELKFMAMQQQNGSWEYMEYEDWDSVSKKLIGSIAHFSTFLDGNYVVLQPQELSARVGTRHDLILFIVQPDQNNPPASQSNSNEDDLPVLPRPATISIKNKNMIWKVNGQLNGNNKVGIVVGVPAGGITGKYTAPSKMTMDSIEVTLDVKEFAYEKVVTRRGKWKSTSIEKRKIADAKFACKVNLYDEYRVTVLKTFRAQLCDAVFKDSASFHIKIFPKDKDISEVNNYYPWLIKPADCKQFKYITEGCTGPVHIDAESIVYHMSKDDAPKINLNFRQVDICVIKNKVAVGSVAVDHTTYQTGLPNQIQFIANGLPQTKDETQSAAGLVYRITVSPVR